MSRPFIRAGLLLTLLPLGACNIDYDIDYGDPLQHPQTWHTQGDNDANLRATVANPQDLVAGRGASDSLGLEAVPPIVRLLAGHRYPLPTANASTISGGTAPQPEGQGQGEGGGTGGAQAQ
jgi:hypothetical protein